jgi:hypothetical protein
MHIFALNGILAEALSMLSAINAWPFLPSWWEIRSLPITDGWG